MEEEGLIRDCFDFLFLLPLKFRELRRFEDESEECEERTTEERERLSLGFRDLDFLTKDL